MLVGKCVIVQMAPADLVQELTRSMAGLVLTGIKHMLVIAFDTCGWDPGRDPWRALCHHEDEPEVTGGRTLRLRDRLCVPRL